MKLILFACLLGIAAAELKIRKWEDFAPDVSKENEDLAAPNDKKDESSYLRLHWSVDQIWEAWKQIYNKKYPTEYEEQRRYKIFVEKYNKVVAHNERYRKGDVSFDVELNRFADMSPMEVKAVFNGFNRQLLNASFPTVSRQTYRKHLLGGPSDKPLPKSVDWRKTAVTPVKDQGHCGSCWAFSTTGALEGQHYMRTKKLVSLSEQNLVDCSAKWGNNGCEGGLMDQAFQYIKDNGGLDLENSYPYEGIDATCRFKNQFVGATDKGFTDIPSGDEDALMHAVATVGPVSIAIDASHGSFHDYTTGVYDEPECGNTPDSLDHGVLVVGYGTDATSGADYWIVKNSWSTAWGDGGYIRIARNKNNMCGVATMASYPNV